MSKVLNLMFSFDYSKEYVGFTFMKDYKRVCWTASLTEIIDIVDIDIYHKRLTEMGDRLYKGGL